MKHPGTITFFIDPARPFDEPLVDSPDDLAATLVEGVDMGLAHALTEFGEDNADSHQRMAARAIYHHDEESANFHMTRRRVWADLRSEVLAAYHAIARIRAN